MKMGALPVFSIGLALFLIFIGFGLREYLPNTEDAKNRADIASKYEAEAAKLGKARQRKKAAEEIVQAKADEWQKVVAARTPTHINVAKHAWQLVVDSQNYRNDIQRAVNAQVKKGGVVVLNGPVIPFPDQDGSRIVSSYYNYPVIPFPVVIFDLGTITVQGTYEQIKQNVKGWSEMPNYLAVADGLTLNGTSPVLTASYSVSMVGYIRGEQIYPAVPEGAAPSGAGGAGGAGGAPGRIGGTGGGGGGGGRRDN